MAGIQLGPFQLFAPIGVGGMGEVWRGWHIGNEVPVAVKVLTASTGDLGEAATFANEVRAVAGLDHPGIVWVFDYGTIPRAASEASSGHLIEGSPYLVMEFASGGTLSRARWPVPWPWLRQVLLDLLAALAHAHSRGVIHRDLKPGNVLLCGPNDVRRGLKIADFGISHAMFLTNPGAGRMAGSVDYMAPEQVRATEGDYGAWTDLYSLGCVAQVMATGRAPFRDLSSAARLQAKLYNEPPPIHAPEAPSGFAEWVSTLLRREPEDRFVSAADAAAALRALGEPTGATPRYDPLAGVIAPSSEPAPLQEVPTVLRPAPTLAYEPRQSGRQLARGPRSQARLPATWRDLRDRRAPSRLWGAGLGLYALRTVPFVGRERELDVLWGCLRGVYEQGRAQAVVIRGGAGVGKSRLVRTVMQRAYQTAGTTPLQIQHGPGEPADQPVRSFVRLVVTGTGDAIERQYRTRAFLSRYARATERDAEALVALSGADSDLRLDPQARQGIMARFLQACSRRRPVLLALEDAQFALDSLSLLRAFLEQQDTRPSPVLWVAVVQEEALARAPEVARALEELLVRPDVRALPIGPLPAPQHAELLQQLIGLAPALAAQVEERTRGNPGFAIELIGDWVGRDALVLGSQGFSLRDPGPVQLPRDLDQVWQARAEHLLEGLPALAEVMLERAAALGQDVHAELWARACDGPATDPAGFRPSEMGQRVRRGLLERLHAARLADATVEGWRFANLMFREAIATRARAADRWQAHHRACAWVMAAAEHEEGVAPQPDRLGAHLVEAGALEAAVEPLLAGVRYRLREVGYRAALGLADTARTVLDELDAAPSDPRRLELLLHRGRALRLMDEHEESVAALTVASSRAYASGRTELAARAWLEIAECHLARRKLKAADVALQHVAAALGPEGHAGLNGICRTVWSWVSRYAGDLDAAAVHAEAAARWLIEAGDDASLARCRTLQGDHALIAGDLDTAGQLYREALLHYQATGDLGGQSSVHARRAAIAWTLGDYARAQRYIDETLVIERMTGRDLTLPMVNLAMIEAARGSHALARERCESLLPWARAEERPRVGAALYAVLLVSCAALDDWPAFDEHLRSCRFAFEQPGIMEAGCAWAATRSGDLAWQRGHIDRAEQAWKLALTQQRRLSAGTAVRALLERLERLVEPEDPDRTEPGLQ